LVTKKHRKKRIEAARSRGKLTSSDDLRECGRNLRPIGQFILRVEREL
jgi:hypothetical protein